MTSEYPLSTPPVPGQRAPNGSTASYHYDGLTSSVIASGEGDDSRRMLSWQKQDQLGRTTLLRSYLPGDDEWTIESELSLAYDTADRLTQVYRRDGGEGRWQRTSSIGYDFLGRKTSMSDADPGNWSYAYNTLGQLTRQTDARDKTSCLYYDDLGRMRGRVQSVSNDNVSRSFTYDNFSRLNCEIVTIDSFTRASSYSYDGASRLTSFNGQSNGYGDSGPYHAVDRIAGVDRFDYDANGNMNVRNKGLSGQQTLAWDAENRLSQVQDNNGDLLEQYWYDVDGARVKKTSGTTTTYTFFAHYEEEVTGGATTAISHYSFGGLRVAVKRGSDLFHLHGDHLGSTSLTTDSEGAATASRAYYAYGSERAATGDLQTDRTFTGQKADASGLMYYNSQ